MHFTEMDLIGKFKPTPQGHQYTLTVTDMVTMQMSLDQIQVEMLSMSP